MGSHAGWKPEFQQYLLEPMGDPFEWQFHQHAMMLLPDGSLLLHDNGNFRAIPFDGNEPLADEDNYTRAVQFSIDEGEMEVSQMWEYGTHAEDIIFSRAQGDADWLSQTDNVLITFSQTRLINGEEQSLVFPRLVEVDRNGQIVFDMAVQSADGSANTYRSERIPTLYPPDYIATAIPEPSAIALAGLGLACLSACGRRRRRI